LSYSNETATQAVVKFGGERVVVRVAELSLMQPAPPPPWLGEWQRPRPPPAFPSETQILERIDDARDHLRQTYVWATQCGDKAAAARQIAERAARECNEARAALRTLDGYDRQLQADAEQAIKDNIPVPLANGHDGRSHVQQRVVITETAQQRFDRELADALAAQGDAIARIRQAAWALIGLLLTREVGCLRAAEALVAAQRRELVAVSRWHVDAALGVIKLDAATGDYLAQQPPLDDLAREGRGWQRSWEAVLDALVKGDHLADFALESETPAE
jgi:hypothetical protein